MQRTNAGSIGEHAQKKFEAKKIHRLYDLIVTFSYGDFKDKNTSFSNYFDPQSEWYNGYYGNYSSTSLWNFSLVQNLLFLIFLMRSEELQGWRFIMGIQRCWWHRCQSWWSWRRILFGLQLFNCWPIWLSTWKNVLQNEVSLRASR